MSPGHPKSDIMDFLDSAATSWGGGRGPAYFGGDNHLPANPVSPADMMQLSLWCSLYLAFAFIVLTSNGRRVVTFIVGSILMATAFSIIRGLSEPNWYVGSTDLEAAISSGDPSARVNATLGVKVGLYSYNVTLFSSDRHNFFFNNRFDLNYGGPARKRRDREFDHKLEAIALGLPNPVIIVAEYMESGEWERCLPSAGYHARVCLFFALTSLAFCAVMLFSVPSHALRAQVLTGLILQVACWVYWFLMPSLDAEVRIDGVPMKFMIGKSFHMILILGMVNLMFGLLVLWLRRTRVMSGFSTFFEQDYDTPWDERKLRADSDERRKNASANNVTKTRKEELLTQMYVDSRLRMTIRRLRRSIEAKRRRAHSHGERTDVEEELEDRSGGKGADDRSLSFISRGRSFSEVAFENESLI